MSPLRSKMVRDMELRRFAPATKRSYLNAVIEPVRYYNRSPDQISQEEVFDYLHYLSEVKQLAWSSINVHA